LLSPLAARRCAKDTPFMEQIGKRHTAEIALDEGEDFLFVLQALFGSNDLVLSNLRSHLVQCYDRQDFPRINNMADSLRSRKHAVSLREWSQELEYLSVALWEFGGLHNLLPPGCDPSPAPGAASRLT
jgi:hypothetical protein